STNSTLPLLLGSGFCYRFVSCGVWLVLGIWNSGSVLVSGGLFRASHRFHFLLQFRRLDLTRALKALWGLCFGLWFLRARLSLFVQQAGVRFVLCSRVVGCIDLSA
ncbi:hypothetical protein Goklo_028172, partial [Gossypium klotzschianum]|nr:hypothetical protein [Gossypium klotzschianum]